MHVVILFVDDLGYNEINTGDHAPPSGGYSGYGGKTQTPHIERCATLSIAVWRWISGDTI
jgi:hypothetical protein